VNGKHSSTATSQVTVGTRYTYLSEAVVEFSEDVTFVKHLAVVAMFIVVGNALSQVTRQLAVRHVLLDLLELRIGHSIRCEPQLLHCVSKRIPDINDCSLKKDHQILIIFDTHIRDTTGH